LTSAQKAIEDRVEPTTKGKGKKARNVPVLPPLYILEHVRGNYYAREIDKQIETLESTIQGLADLWNRKLIGQAEARHAISTAARRREELADRQKKLLERFRISPRSGERKPDVSLQTIQDSLRYFQELIDQEGSLQTSGWKDAKSRVDFGHRTRWAASVLSDQLSTRTSVEESPQPSEKLEKPASSYQTEPIGIAMALSEAGKEEDSKRPVGDGIIRPLGSSERPSSEEIDELNLLRLIFSSDIGVAEALDGLILVESDAGEDAKKTSDKDDSKAFDAPAGPIHPLVVIDSSGANVGEIIDQITLSERKLGVVRLARPSMTLVTAIASRMKTTHSSDDPFEVLEKGIQEILTPAQVHLDPDTLWQLCLSEKIPLLPHEIRLGFFGILDTELLEKNEEGTAVRLSVPTREALLPPETVLSISPCVTVRSEESSSSIGRFVGADLQESPPKMLLLVCPINSQAILAAFGRQSDSSYLRRVRDRVSSALELPSQRGLCPDALARYFLHYAREIPRDEISTVSQASQWLHERLKMRSIPVSSVLKLSPREIIIRNSS
jgi:hypothetical protein